MKRVDKRKVSLVDFLASIKFARHHTASAKTACPTHFAHFHPRIHTGSRFGGEESQLVRSAN